MTTKLALLSVAADFIAAELGLDFKKRGGDLRRIIQSVAREQDHVDAADYIQRLLANGPTSSELEALVCHLTVGETHFYRDRRALEALEERILPELLSKPARENQLSIWSAGCSTGEEPYSIAMVIDRAKRRLKTANVKIFATDVNRQSLQKASAGTYGEWSFRGTPSWVKATYFQEIPGPKWSILPSIKSAVAFRRLNLVKDSYSSLSGEGTSIDVIFCRNVLMYLTPEAIRQVVSRFYQALSPDGWLVVSPAETSRDLFAEFMPISLKGATLYRKCDVPPRIVATSDISIDPGPTVQAAPAAIFESAVAYSGTQPTPQGTQQSLSCDSTVSDAPARHESAEAIVLARTCANQGKLAEALSWCEEALAADKMLATGYYLKSLILQEQGLQQEAIQSLRQAVYVDPKFVLGHFALGNLSLRQGKLGQSRKHFENVSLLLTRYKPEDIIPESDGMSAGRMRAMLPQDARFPDHVSLSRTERVTVL